MAECRCGVCEHCADSLRALVSIPGVTPEPEWSPPPDEPLRGVKPRRLLTKTRVEELRANWVSELPSFGEVLDAYETAVHLLEEVVRVSRDLEHITSGPTLVNEIDVAWLALRDAER